MNSLVLYVERTITASILAKIREDLLSSSHPEKTVIWAIACTPFFGFFLTGRTPSRFNRLGMGRCGGGLPRCTSDDANSFETVKMRPVRCRRRHLGGCHWFGSLPHHSYSRLHTGTRQSTRGVLSQLLSQASHKAVVRGRDSPYSRVSWTSPTRVCWT